MVTMGQRYGTTHRHLRTHLVTRYEQDGRGWPCALCDQPMHDHPSQLHLAHNADSSHAGLAHKACNTGDAARIGNRTRHGYDGQPNPQPRPRTQW